MLPGGAILCNVDLPWQLRIGSLISGKIYITSDVCTNLASGGCQNPVSQTQEGDFATHVDPILSSTPSEISFSSSSTTFAADGKYYDVIAKLKLLGYPLSGATVQFSESPAFGSLYPKYADTDSNGNVTAEISSKTSGSTVLTASFAGISNSITITFVTPVYVKFEINQANTGYPILSIDSVSYSDLPITLPLIPGSQHSYSFESTIPDTSSERYVYSSASGCGISAESGIFVASNCTATGDYNVQYYLTAYSAEPSEGTVSPASSWYTSGTQVTETAAALSGYEFAGWSGSGPGSYSGLQNPITVTLNNPITEAASFATALSASISPSSATIDSGQQAQFTASASGGVSPYSYQWYSGSSSTCSSDTAISGATSQTYTASPSSSAYYCVKATDSASGSSYSNAAYVTVNPVLSSSISPTSATIDSGQSVSFTASYSGGTSPYSYQWYTGSSSTCSSDTAISGATSSTYSASPSSSTYYCVRVTDGTGAAAYSPAAYVTVNPPLSLSPLTTSPSSGQSGQSETLTGTISGGTSPYAVTALSGSIEGSMPTSDCSISSSTVTCTFSLPSVSSQTTDIYSLTVSDSASETSTNTGQVTVNPPCSGGTVTYTTPQTYTVTVPANCNTAYVQLYGAGGGSGGSTAGSGGYVSGTISVTPGSTLYLWVGAGGGYGTYECSGSYCNDGGAGGFPGGGNGGDAQGAHVGSENGGGGGGGFSAISTTSSYSTGTLLVAAGGGGSGGLSKWGPAGIGGAGDYTVGYPGGDGAGDLSCNGTGGGFGGTGGGQTTGGSAGSGGCIPSTLYYTSCSGGSGAAFSGGFGGPGCTVGTGGTGGGGGGGGGGYYGGGGGGSGTGSDTGGDGGGGGAGGGSNWYASTVSGVTSNYNGAAGGTSGSNGSNGEIEITWS